MRIVRSINPPRRHGRGFSVRAGMSLAAAVLASALIAPAPARAETVTVRFGLSAGVHANTGVLCPVKVAPGASGISVLDAAKAKGCIRSYKAQYYPGLGHLIRCFNGVCQIDRPLVLYWAMFENGQFTPYGVDGFSANAGDQLVFVYSR